MGHRHTLPVLCAWLLIAGPRSDPVAPTTTDVQINTPDHDTGDADNFTSQSEPSHAAAGPLLVACWNDSGQIAFEGVATTSYLGYGYSLNDGADWIDAGPLPTPAGYLSWSDPAVAADTAGKFYLACTVVDAENDDLTRIIVHPAAKAGPAITLGTPAMIAGLDAKGYQDKPLLTVDRSGGAADGRVYAAWTEFVQNATGLTETRVLVARSQTQTPLLFDPAVAVSGTDTEVKLGATPVVGPGGELYVAWARHLADTAVLQIVKSTDGGASFSNPDPSDSTPAKTIAAAPWTLDVLDGYSTIRTEVLPALAVDRTPVGSATRGNVYLAYQADPDDAGTDRADVFFVRSTDGGQSWSMPRNVTKAPAVTAGADTTLNDNWQPTISVSPVSGDIVVTFYDRRDDQVTTDGDPANTRIRVYAAVSTDAGLTWYHTTVSDSSFRPWTNYDSSHAADYMGDYNCSFSDGAAILVSWTDCRHKVVVPASPASPPTPGDRTDMDVFFHAVTPPGGPDLFVQPWGHITGEGPHWQSPAIFVVDNSGNEVPPAKGAVNQLRARVSNVGDTDAVSAKVTFRYAPWFAGIADSALMEIGSVTVNCAAGATEIVPIDWDLGDLTETNGGQWPQPIDAFEHFCVKVDIELAGDANPANNSARSNFDDVSTVSGASPMFLVGNPEERKADARLRVRNVPPGYRIELDGDALAFDQRFTLASREIRTARLRITRPDDAARRRAARDLVAEVDLELDGVVVSGLALRLARGTDASSTPPATQDREEFTQPIGEVFEAVTAILGQQQTPIAMANRERGLITTRSIPLSADRLRELIVAEAAERYKGREGRYLLSVKLTVASNRNTIVEVSTRIIVSLPVGGQFGGRPAASNGSLENAILAPLRAKFR